MATKKPSAKKSVKSASAPTTMTATLVPAKPWHSRGAVAIVLVVIIAVLAVGFVAVGMAWSRKVTELNKQITLLQSQLQNYQQRLASLENNSQNLQQVLSIERRLTGGNTNSIVTVNDNYLSNSGFSLEFPSSWGLVEVGDTDLSATDWSGGTPQYISYQFKPSGRFTEWLFEIIIGDPKKKDDPILKDDRVLITENDQYIYWYGLRKTCGNRCSPRIEEDKKELQKDLTKIIPTFKLLK